jgi:hypothetical protein
LQFRFVGTDLKEKCIEFLLMIGGVGFYHIYLRPKDYLESRRKKKNAGACNKAKETEKAVTPV